MNIYVNPNSKIIEKGSVVTVGSFDGVHCGHHAILDAVKSLANNHNLEASIVTLFPHPRVVLGLDTTGFGVLSTLKEKEELLAECEIDNLIEIEFTKEFSNVSSETFAREFLVGILNAKIVVVGYNHHFGHNRSGNYDQLKSIGKEFGFEVVEIPQHNVDLEKVSSTIIRNALHEGDIEVVNRYLGYSYFMLANITCEGVVVLNDSMKLLPPSGVYTVEVSTNRAYFTTSLIIDNNRHVSLTGVNEALNGEVKIKFVKKDAN